MKKVFQVCKQQQEERLRLIMEHGGGSTALPQRFILLSRQKVENARGETDVEQSRRVGEEEDAYYREMDITPVWYDALGKDHSALRLALERLANLPEIAPNHGWEGESYAI